MAQRRNPFQVGPDQPGFEDPGGVMPNVPQSYGGQYQPPPQTETNPNPNQPVIGGPDPGVDPNRPNGAPPDKWGELIGRSFQTAWHRAPTADETNYWTGKLNSGQRDDNYWEQRMLGSGSGGADVVPYGPYAGQDIGTGPAGGSGSGMDISGLLAQLTSSIGSGGGGGGMSAPPAAPANVDIKSIIAGLLNPQQNLGRITSRTGQARDALERQRQAEGDTLSAKLADRGQLGGGGETSALMRQGERLGSQFADDVAGIYTDESQRADDQLIQVLSLATGLSVDEARNEIARFQAETQRSLGSEQNDISRLGTMGNLALGQGRLGLDSMLGTGNLALGNMNSVNDYNLGLANYGLNRDVAQFNMQNTDVQSLIGLLQMLVNQSGISAGGAVRPRTP